MANKGKIIMAAGLMLLLGSFILSRTRLYPDTVLAHYFSGRQYPAIQIVYPLDKTVFPPEIVAPRFRWKDSTPRVDTWVIRIQAKAENASFQYIVKTSEWSPKPSDWERIKTLTRQSPSPALVLGFDRSHPREVLSKGGLEFSTSEDETGAPIFYREVNLPFIDAVKDPTKIRWCFGDIGSPGHPKVVLSNLPVCGNCHSFSKDGQWFGMDVDYANNKGSYIVTRTGNRMALASSNIFTWDDFKRGSGDKTYGFLSQISPDGAWVISTVKDKSVFVAKPDLAFSQLFFPLQGILAYYDRKDKSFHELPGANDPSQVQSNPVWSPDGKTILFARSAAYRLKNTGARDKLLLTPEECKEFADEGKPFQYDIYRIPFNDGKGGQPEPLEGASRNGKSNFFPRYSPDGKWIVFCQSSNYMLLQPDSELFIVPAQGGQARRLSCNTSRMNSWHSWSPNGKWLVFSSKAFSPYTQLFLTHIETDGNSTPPVLLEQFTLPDRAANIPEFVNLSVSGIEHIDEDFLNDLSYARSAYAFDRAGDVDSAIRDYNKALHVNPDNPQSHLRLGHLLYHNKQNFKEGMAHTIEAVRLNPKDACALFDLGAALFHQGKLDEAIEPLKKAVDLPNNLPVLYPPEDIRGLLGTVCLLKGDTAGAIEYMTQAVDLAPKRADLHYRLALALASSGNIDKAAAHKQSAIDLDAKIDNSPDLHMFLSDNYANAGRLPEAIAEAKQALAIARAADERDAAKEIAAKIETLMGDKSGAR